MVPTGSIYTLHEHLCLTILNRGRRLLPDDQQAITDSTNLPKKTFNAMKHIKEKSNMDTRPKSNAMFCKGGVKNVKSQLLFFFFI